MNIQNAEQTWKQLNLNEHIAESKLSWFIQLAKTVNYLNLCDFDTQWLKILLKQIELQRCYIWTVKSN
jgi:hypothetical protein